MRLSNVVHLVGLLLRPFGAAFIVPLAVALAYGERGDAVGFALASLVAVVVGQALYRSGGPLDDDLRRVEGLAVVSGTWLVAAAVGAIPYAWVGVGPLDSLFESMSGLTTTGATIFEDFERYGRGLFFWRALSQWLGGMGVITLFVAVLPRLAIGGRQLFFAEAPGPTDEKLTPQIRKTAAVLWWLYVGLTALELAALKLAGMPLYDAACHALTNLSAGGFSPHPLSIQGYASPAIEWIIICFMFIAGASFSLQYRALRHPKVLGRDEEFKLYAGLVLIASVLLAVFLWRDAAGSAMTSVRVALFQVLSIITTTGYTSVDFQTWSDQSKMVLLILMFVGGSAGSAAGGPKVVRQLLMFRYVRAELRRTLHPQAVLPVKLGGRVVPEDVMRAVLVFFLFYVLVFVVCILIVVAFGEDLVSGVTAAIATLGNIGPGFNSVGPTSSYAGLHPVSKVTLIAAMWIGRLEVLTVLVLLRPEAWSDAQWRGGAPGRQGARSENTGSI